MKRYLILVFVILLASSVLANNKIKLDINLEKQMLLPLSENDMIEFYLNNSRHVINIEKIRPESMDLDIFLFVDENQKTSYITVEKGKSMKIDINKDSKEELYLGYGGHYGNKTLLFVYNPNAEGKLTEITGGVIKENPVALEGSNKWYYVGAILVLILALISILVYINTRKNWA